MGCTKLKYKPLGYKGLLIEWSEKSISEQTLHEIITLEFQIKECFKNSIQETIPAYHSLAVLFKEKIDHQVVTEKVESLLKTASPIVSYPSTTWRVPVCYDLGFGFDLKALSNAKNISIDKIIALHTDQTYIVHFIGFLPGFLYLGNLNKQLEHPRKKQPRLSIKKGSVGIGGNQTGIYPSTSPGGWNIIGNSPINFFKVKDKIPCFAKPGDKIKFYAISKKEHSKIEHLVQQDNYQIAHE